MFTLVGSSGALVADLEREVRWLNKVSDDVAKRLASAEAVIRAAPCEHEHFRFLDIGKPAILCDCIVVDCERPCPRCAWLRDA